VVPFAAIPSLREEAEPVTAPPRTFSVELAYEGSGFLGWQIQPVGRTVQGELGAACERILDQPLKVAGAGRTDTGVHALAGLASFEARTPRRADQLFRGLRRILPPDMHVRRVDERPPGFHARFSARSRQYLYRWVRGADPFRRDRAWCTTYRLDLEAMRAELSALAGRRDCRGLCVAGSLPPEAWCVFHLAELGEHGDELRFRVRCDRFLHSMVRGLAGTLHDVGRGRLASGSLEALLASGERSRCGVVAPACGLYLEQVGYEGFSTGGAEGWSRLDEPNEADCAGGGQAAPAVES
jgi:tRNA pseudouridine38-40 synthase